MGYAYCKQVASNKLILEGGTKMKKFVGAIMAMVLCFGVAISANAATLNTEEVVVESNEAEAVITRAVSIDKDFSIATGKSWSANFTMTKWFADDHNAFKVIVSDVSGGSYRVKIEGDNGFSYTSDEYTNSGCTLTITNAQSSVKYTVYIGNTGSGTVSGNVKISSYYN